MVSIPVGRTRVVFGSSIYYHCDGVYYKRVPYGYQVVEAPRITRTEIIRETYNGSAMSPADSGDLVSVTEHTLNVRSGPGMDFPVVRHVRRGETLEVRGLAPDWLYVRLPSGEYGWILDRYTTLIYRGGRG
jgi:uncharacterized protein YraI